MTFGKLKIKEIYNVEIKIDKKFFIKLGIVAILCFASFCAGRLIRFKGISGSGEQLISGVILERDTADKLLDELGIARPAGQSASDTGYAVLRGIQELSKSNDAGQKCINLLKSEIAFDLEIYEKYKSTDLSKIDKELDIAVEQALRYEQLLKESQLIIYEKNN